MSTPNEEAGLEATNWGDPKGGGILAAMERAFDEPSTESIPINKEVEAAPTPPQKQEETPTATPEKTEEPEEVMEESFFAKEEEKPAASSEEFDAAAFDKQTEETTKGMDAKAGEKFKELRTQLKEFQQKEQSKAIPEDVQKKMQELELKAAEAEGLRTRLLEVSSQSAKLQVENDDEYLRQVAKPAASIFAKLDEISEIYEGDKEILRSIVKTRDRKVQNELIAEQLKEFSEFDRAEVYRMAQDFGKLVEKREEMLEEADTKIEARKLQRIENEKKLLNEQRLAVQTQQKQLWEKYKEKVPGLVDEKGETEIYRKLMNQSMAIDFSQAKASDMAFAAFSGSLLPHAMKELVALRNRLAMYEKEEDRKQGKAPSPSGSVQATPANKTAPKTFMERMEAATFA